MPTFVCLKFLKAMLYFDTDYMAGAHPRIIERLSATNLEMTPGYGNDAYTERAKELILREAGISQGEVHFLVGGTQTNATVIDALLAHHEGVVAAESSHVNVHEAGAIEASGHKVLVVPSHAGKVDAAEVDHLITEFYKDATWQHMVAPGMVYISQPTELGTLYTKSELEALHAVCRRHEIPLYVDGARLGYGLAGEGNDVSLKDLARLCDVFYIGGTKVGTLFGEAVVATRKGLLPHFFTLVKQHGALLAKGRLLGVQFATLFEDGLYFEMGQHAVRLALKLKEAFRARGYELFMDSPTNQQFVRLDNAKMDELRKEASFENWGPRGEHSTVVRLVTSWATREEDVDRLISLL